MNQEIFPPQKRKLIYGKFCLVKKIDNKKISIKNHDGLAKQFNFNTAQGWNEKNNSM